MYVKFSITPFLLLTLLMLPLLGATSVQPFGFSAQGVSLVCPASAGRGSQPTTSENSPLPGPDLAVANWSSNHIRNPDFETWNNPQSPTEWSTYAPGDAYHWFATQPPWYINEGTYSMGLQCRGPNLRYSYAYVAQYDLDVSMSNLTLRSDWFLDQNLDPVDDGFYLQVSTFDGSSYRYLYYFLNGTTSGTNSTSYGYYLRHDPSHQWNTLSLNLTADFLAIPAFPKTIAPGLIVKHIWFYLWASAVTGNLLRAFVDDVWLEDGNTIVVGGTTRNGNFEAPGWSYWSNGGDRDASDAHQSVTAHSGNWSLNLTAAAAGNASYAYASTGPRVRVTSLNQALLNCWWWLTLTNIAWSSYAYVYLNCFNSTTSWFGVYYFLGYYGTSAPWSNDSSTLLLHANQFNTTGTWVAFHRNLWQDAASHFHTNEIFIREIYFEVTTYGAESRVGLLVDGSSLVSGAVNGAGFEDQGNVGSQVQGWDWVDPAFTVTGTAYAGSKAANLTLGGGLVWSNDQFLAGRPLNSTRETYLDVMWRLQTYASSAGTYAFVYLTLSDSRSLGYYFAVSSSLPFVNTSYSAWFNVTGVNTVGAWVAMHRDLAHDYETVFGILPDTTIDTITLAVATATGPGLVLLLDDLYLYDDPAPRISGVTRNPLVPDHNQAVQVTASLVDQDLATRLVRYRVNSASWQTVAMTHQSGTTYAGMIPGQPHNSLVEYYVTANDTWGMTTTALNGDVYWSYTALDQSSPLLAIDAPGNGATVSGTVKVNVTATDAVTGVAQVRFRIDTGTPVNDSTAPYQYAWDTTHVSNGAHTITVTAVDGAGNPATASITVTVSNATAPPPIPGFPSAAILLACGAAFSIALVRRRRRS